MNSWTIALNVTKRTLGSPRKLLLHIVLPVLVISLIVTFLGMSHSGRTELLYLNLDEGWAGAYLITELKEHGTSMTWTEAPDREAAKEAVMEKRVQLGLMIPSGFSEAIRKGAPIPVELYELSVSEASMSVRMSIQQKIEELVATQELIAALNTGDAAIVNALEQAGLHRVQGKVSDLKLELDFSLGLTTGILLIFLMGLINSSISAIIEDRRSMTMARMYAAPVTSFEIAFGNFLGSFLVGTIQIVAVLTVTRLISENTYSFSFIEHWLVLEAFLLAVMGMASSVAGAVRHTENISAIYSMVATPTCMIGGCFWPVSIMPEFMQKLSYFVPQSWAINAITSLASGQSLIDVAMNLGVLLLFGFVLLGLGSVILKPSVS